MSTPLAQPELEVKYNSYCKLRIQQFVQIPQNQTWHHISAKKSNVYGKNGEVIR